MMDAWEYAAGFPGLERIKINGNDFEEGYFKLEQIIRTIRKERRPFIVQANVPLLGHHTSGVRKEFYRTTAELEKAATQDPRSILRKRLKVIGFSDK